MFKVLGGLNKNFKLTIKSISSIIINNKLL